MHVAYQAPKLPEMDEDGLLVDPQTWNEVIASVLANQVGIRQLSEDHWKVIHALRKYYDQFGVAPAMANICHAEHHDAHWVHELFGTCLNAWIVSGLPNPGEEAKTYLSDT
jgi:TusE/DsrC/DsvC family sulfur relay protein